MSTKTYTEDELIDMSDADRDAAIEAMQFETGGEPGAVVATTTPGEPDAPVTIKDINPPPNAAAVATPAADAVSAAAAPAAAAVAEVEPGVEPGAAPITLAPVYVAQVPQDVDAKLEQIKTEKSALRAKYDAGDLTFDQYEDAKDELAERATELKMEVNNARVAAEMEEQRKANVWAATCDAFVADKVYKDNPRMYKLLDLEVREVGSSETGKAMTFAQILATAHKNLVDAGIVTAGTGAAPKEATTKDKVEHAPLPPNLALVPSAQGTETGGSKWSNLMKLADTDIEAYEEAVMKLSDADRNALLRAQA